MNKQLERPPVLTLPRAADHVWRAAAAKVRSYARGGLAVDVAKEMYPDDELTAILVRAATGPAVTSVPAWAGALARYAVAEAVQEVVSFSAAGKVVAAGALKVDLGRNHSVTVPGRSSTPADAGQWIEESKPIPVRQYQAVGPTLTAHKLAVITTFTRELADASNIEQVLRTLISEAAGPAIDAAIFSTAAATPARSKGILNGLTPLAEATGSAYDAVASDLGTLVGDIASRNGGANAVFVGAPGQAMTIKFFSGGAVEIFGSVGVPARTVIAIEPSSLAIVLGNPEFELSNAPTLHMEDTAPADISGASPVKSMFQTDSLALKMTLYGDWGMRAPHVAWMDSVAW